MHGTSPATKGFDKQLKEEGQAAHAELREILEARQIADKKLSDNFSEVLEQMKEVIVFMADDEERVHKRLNQESDGA